MQEKISTAIKWATKPAFDFTKAPLDVARAMLMRLPGAESVERLIEIPNPDAPEQDVLDMRCSMW